MFHCPACHTEIAQSDSEMRCRGCNRAYPVYGNRPVLILEDRSIFSHDDYKDVPTLVERKKGIADLSWPSVNLSARRCFEELKRELLVRENRPVVLVVGGGIRGKGMSVLLDTPEIEVVNVDPNPTSTAHAFADAHDLPFATGSVDAVVTQAVLEHVADPVRCVAEIHRVLKPGGLVYSEIPFMQQVHEEGYDFTRFSHMGQRRLFRRFDEIKSGAVAGPGTSLAWAWRYFLSAMTDFKPVAKVLHSVGRATALVIEQTDYLFRQKPGALDAASCVYFFGRRAESEKTDRELVASYRGNQR